MSITLFILAGATGSGKSELSIPLARSMDAEIVSADSMAVYRGMDIGTAKPSLEQRAYVPHHLIDILEPWEEYSTGSFVAHASKAIENINRRGKKILLVGGTALYIKSLLEGIFEGPPADWELRTKLSQIPLASLYEELSRVDPEAAQKIAPNDLRRVIRALEVFHLTGQPISLSRHLKTRPVAPYTACFMGVHWERQLLYERIERRVEAMMEKGLIQETKRLLSGPFPLSKSACQAIGYKETIEMLSNHGDLGLLPDMIKRNTRRFAKRQMTWLRRFPITWVECGPEKSLDQVVQECERIWRIL